MSWPIALAAIAGSVMDYVSGRNSARDQMEFQEDMSNTAFSRAATDLQAAGLNRILALGNPASTPGGAMAPMSNLGGAVVQGFNAKTQAELVSSQKDLMDSQSQREDSQALVNAKQAQLLDTQQKIQSVHLSNLESNPQVARWNAELQEINQRIENLKSSGEGIKVDNQIKELQKQRDAIQLEKEKVTKGLFEGVTPAVEDLKGWLPNAYNSAKSFISEGIEDVGEFFSGAGDYIQTKRREAHAATAFGMILEGKMNLDDIKDPVVKQMVEAKIRGKKDAH